MFEYCFSGFIISQGQSTRTQDGISKFRLKSKLKIEIETAQLLNCNFYAMNFVCEWLCSFENAGNVS